MKKTCLSLFAVLLISIAGMAQKPELKNMDDSLKYGWWKRQTQLGANLSGSAFSQSWQGGGVNNFLLGGVFGNRADFTKGKGVWSNDLQLQVGNVTNKVAGVRESRKNIDRLFFETKYSQKINPKVNWFASINLLSQFLKGVDYADKTKPIASALFAPAFLSQGIGLEYKPSKFFSLNFGGATLRQTIVASNKVWDSPKYKGKGEVFGVPRGKNVKNQGGFQVVGAYDKNINPRVNLKWRWQIFTPYQFNEFDHNVNAIATIKVNKYMNLNGTLIGIFDKSQTAPSKEKPWQLNGGANLGFALQL